MEEKRPDLPRRIEREGWGAQFRLAYYPDFYHCLFFTIPLFLENSQGKWIEKSEALTF
jgi:hypothetical protein